ncbi:hypothetical protein LX36DRAFT_472964 [Colletotrichum falcatum]|nr:hypothetical protein LX36DRAFT_472964 [Colletotrichum falcatum]
MVNSLISSRHKLAHSWAPREIDSHSPIIANLRLYILKTQVPPVSMFASLVFSSRHVVSPQSGWSGLASWATISGFASARKWTALQKIVFRPTAVAVWSRWLVLVSLSRLWRTLVRKASDSLTQHCLLTNDDCNLRFAWRSMAF